MSASTSGISRAADDNNINKDDKLINRSSSVTPIEKDTVVLETEKKITCHNDNNNNIKNKHRHKTLLQHIDHNQINGTLTLMGILLLIHFIFPQNFTKKFLHLQYKYPDSEYYDIGKDDAFFVFNWIVIFTFIRAALMDWLFGPIAIKILKIHNKKRVIRFKEQGWSFFYYSVSWAVGFYLYYHSDYYFDCDNMWIGWPHDKMPFSMKCYYLCQMACWFQQIIVLNIEEKRKDYLQMFSHHIVTCVLVIASYYYYFTKIGHVILVLMDFVDIILPLAKMLRYSGFTTICDLLFIIFLVNWTVLRHGIYCYIVWHTHYIGRNLIANANCALFINEIVKPKRCFTDRTIDIFVILLSILQIILLTWMYLILKVFYKVITGTGADDVRSDSEQEDE